MKHLFVYCITAVLLCVCAPPNLIAAETIKLTNGEWAPYTSEKLKAYGFLSHLTSEAFNAAGIKVEYEFFPWNRAKKLVEFGRRIGSVGAWVHDEEREKIFHFSKPLFESTTGFFYLKEKPFDWLTEDDLQGIRIGATLGYFEEEYLNKMKEEGKNIFCDTANTELQSFRKLLAGRIQIFACQMEVGFNIIRKNFDEGTAKRIMFHPKKLYTKKMHAIFSKQNENGKKYAELFNKGLEKLKEGGEYNRIVEDFRNGHY